MGNFNFKKDLDVEQTKCIPAVTPILEKWLRDNIDTDVTLLEIYDGPEYDLKYDIGGLVKTFEVKEDFKCAITFNVAIEFHSWGKPSGIDVTTADFYVYRIHLPNGILHYIMPTRELRRIIDEKIYHSIKPGGDEGSNTMNYLFFLKDIKAISINMEES